MRHGIGDKSDFTVSTLQNIVVAVTADSIYNLYIIFEPKIMSEHLLLKFRDKDSPYGITRDTLKVLAAELGMPETTIIHLAVSRFAKDVLHNTNPMKAHPQRKIWRGYAKQQMRNCRRAR